MRLRPELVGETVRCKHCKHEFRVEADLLIQHLRERFSAIRSECETISQRLREDPVKDQNPLESVEQAWEVPSTLPTYDEERTGLATVASELARLQSSLERVEAERTALELKHRDELNRLTADRDTWKAKAEELSKAALAPPDTEAVRALEKRLAEMYQALDRERKRADGLSSGYTKVLDAAVEDIAASRFYK